MHKRSSNIPSIESRLSYTFQDRNLLEKALTHPSAGGLFFQRLEFLGDRVLGLTIAQWLCEQFPNDPEGNLTKRLANMVNRTALNRVAQSLNLSLHIISDTETAYNSHVMADSCEALLGAIYLDTGLASAQTVIQTLWAPLLDEHTAPPSIDAKSALQEHLQGEKRPLPMYTLVSQAGPSHNPVFKIRLDIDAADHFMGTGKSKRDAEQHAAQCALNHYLGATFP
jgi:ribonuclease-3